MPAHTSAAQVGVARLVNGQALTHADRRANTFDKHAKLAAATYATTDALRDKLRRQAEVVAQAARWLGWVTWASSNDNTTGGRDSVASRSAANLVRNRRLNLTTRHTRTRPKTAAPKAALRRDQSDVQKANSWSCRAEAVVKATTAQGG